MNETIVMGTVVPVVYGDDGKQRVPLKPIVNQIGVGWESQRERVRDGYLCRRFGITVDTVRYGRQRRRMVLIRLDRVTAYVNTLNAERVRVMGNTASADFIEKKHQEFSDVISGGVRMRAG